MFAGSFEQELHSQEHSDLLHRWFLTKSIAANPEQDFRRQGETLFIDARNIGSMIDRTHKELSAEDIGEIARTYRAWRGEAKDGEYEDQSGFCKSATLKEIKGNDFVLTPGRYVGRLRSMMMGFRLR